MSSKDQLTTLPAELLTLILTFLPRSSLPTARLISHTLDTHAFPLTFTHLSHWLSYEKSHSAIISQAHDIYNRPAVMWSPWALGPDEPVDHVWMGVVWKFLVKTDPPGLERRQMEGRDEHEEEVEVLTAANFGKLSGREEMTENRLRTGQNRFKMWRSYTEMGGNIW